MAAAVRVQSPHETYRNQYLLGASLLADSAPLDSDRTTQSLLSDTVPVAAKPSASRHMIITSLFTFKIKTVVFPLTFPSAGLSILYELLDRAKRQRSNRHSLDTTSRSLREQG